VTFDFTPDWLGTATSADCPRPASAAVARVKPSPLVAPPCAPAPPTINEMAVLVGELFTEGSLSFEQLCSLSHAPELKHLLGDTMAKVAPSRRKAG
jgi:hypothetical protein